jgi:hypothetical protein
VCMLELGDGEESPCRSQRFWVDPNFIDIADLTCPALRLASVQRQTDHRDMVSRLRHLESPTRPRMKHGATKRLILVEGSSMSPFWGLSGEIRSSQYHGLPTEDALLLKSPALYPQSSLSKCGLGKAGSAIFGDYNTIFRNPRNLDPST